MSEPRKDAQIREWKPADGWPLPPDSMWDTRSLARIVLEASTDGGTCNIWLARDLARLALAEAARGDEFRIEADCGLRDYDGLELDFGIARRALEQIAEGRPNRTFDPWSRDLARSALSEVKHD